LPALKLGVAYRGISKSDKLTDTLVLDFGHGWRSLPMNRWSSMNLSCVTVFVLGLFLLLRQPTGAQPKSQAAPHTIESPTDEVARVFGRVVLRREIEPTAEWLDKRNEHIQKRGITPGLVSLEEYRRGQLHTLIVKPLFEEYREREKLDPTEEEVAEFIVRWREAKERAEQYRQETLQKRQDEAEQLRTRLRTQALTRTQRLRLTERVRRMEAEIVALKQLISASDNANDDEGDRRFAQWWLTRWRLQQSLYRRYGGRVIYQQVGPEAIDAMRDFLREHEEQGRFTISDSKLNALFWTPFEREKPGVIVRNPETVFAKPWSLFQPLEE
jgi:hypothetical protein